MRYEGEGRTTSEQVRKGDCASEGRIGLIPVDADTSRTSGRDTKVTAGLTLEPRQCPLVISQVGLELFQASAIVILHPLLLVLGKHTILDHLGLNGDTGEPLKTEPALAVKLAFGLDSSHGEGGFYPDTELSRKVWGRVSVTSTVCQTRKHSQKPGSFVITCPGTRVTLLENECGPSWTFKNDPTPCPVPWP